MKTQLTLLLMGIAGLAANGQGRPAKPTTAPAKTTAGPCQQPVAAGRYACGHTSMRGMFMAYPDLTIKSATAYTQDNQSGTYRYDAVKRQITWLTGPLAKTGWHGEYFPVGCEYTDAYGAKNSMTEATIEMLDSKNVSVYTGKLASK
ncbi:hypothetical protein [Hymenobacter properus]|uniref:Uncharacterized protein n=1 Tax=Hymenobacter properus TaxID=2791026 RepID=A0A931BEA1_9BACT|nr:hypothetical protein [Hymenobacter properus]MBF9142209.1 hypothetical protein [Hymenobacter properus]MBR7721016.1 hypothetical protein [Microvirga sp. SRT04]